MGGMNTGVEGISVFYGEDPAIQNSMLGNSAV